MFYYIEGTADMPEPNLAVVDCSGVGYALNITSNTASQIKPGAKVRLYVSESIGESNFDLYGFISKSEKRCFEMLLSVSGIGPKAALSILSYNSPESLALAVINEDLKALTVAPGVGRKIAQRVILELKDKIRRDMGGTADISAAAPAPAAPQTDSSALNDAMTALAVLGYSNVEIVPALRKLDTAGMSAEQIIKAVLKSMVK